MKGKIPKSFMLMGSTWTVEIKDNLMQRHGIFGLTDNATQVILLQKTNKDFKKDAQYQTFKHELVHSFLFSLNEEDLNRNEKFVDMLASLIVQVEKTAIYK